MMTTMWMEMLTTTITVMMIRIVIMMMTITSEDVQLNDDVRGDHDDRDDGMIV